MSGMFTALDAGRLKVPVGATTATQHPVRLSSRVLTCPRTLFTQRENASSSARTLSLQVDAKKGKKGGKGGKGGKKQLPDIPGYVPSKLGAPPREKTKADLDYERLVREGATIYAVFVRAKGPYQWFPVGPMALPEGGDINKEIYKAEEDLVKAALKMYPKLTIQKNTIGLQYGFRLRDAPQMSEQEILDEKTDPFANVELAVKPQGPSVKKSGDGQAVGNVLSDALKNFEKMFTGN